MAEVEEGSPEPLEELEEHRWLPVEGEGEEEAHSLEVVVVVVEEVGLLFLVMEEEEEVEQGPQGEEEEGVGVELGHQVVEEEEVGVGAEELLNQEVMAVEVEELTLSLPVMVAEEVVEEEVVEEEVPQSVLVKNEPLLLLL